MPAYFLHTSVQRTSRFFLKWKKGGERWKIVINNTTLERWDCENSSNILAGAECVHVLFVNMWAGARTCYVNRIMKEKMCLQSHMTSIWHLSMMASQTEYTKPCVFSTSSLFEHHIYTEMNATQTQQLKDRVSSVWHWHNKMMGISYF